MPEDFQREEINPLQPSLAEMGVGVLSVLHLLLVAVVVVQMLRGRVALPYGFVGLVVLLAVPLLGPVLVLSMQTRFNRRRAQEFRAELVS